MRKLLFCAALLCYSLQSSADVFREVLLTSNFIWKGYTLSNNKPVVQGLLGYEFSNQFYLGTAYSNVEFSNPAFKHAEARKDIDFFVAKKFELGKVNVDFKYSWYTFFEAHYFNTDIFDLRATYGNFVTEFSYMDDYFHTKSTFLYSRIGYMHPLNDKELLGLYVGYSHFSHPKGEVRTTSLADTMTGAGNTNYSDAYLSYIRTFDHGIKVEFAYNWTNRKIYSVSAGESSKVKANDETAVVTVKVPF